MRPSYLIHGLPGHPLHPPLTDATIGAYTLATIAAFAQVVGITEHAGATAWWLGLVVGLITSALTVSAGLADWLSIRWGTPLKRVANAHALVMVAATIFFVVAIVVGHRHYEHGLVGTWPFVLTLIGFATLTAGGWLGGALTYVHGMRVLSLVDEPALRSAAPLATPEKREAENV